MSGELCLRNRQRTRPVSMLLLRTVTRHLLDELLGLEAFDLTVNLVNAVEMSRLNEIYLRHKGSTDVITLDYSITGPAPTLAGEIFVCVDESLLQARQFKTTWQSELARYIVHGVLHLQGHDDRRVDARSKMKREEDRRLRELAQEFDLSKLRLKPKVTA